MENTAVQIDDLTYSYHHREDRSLSEINLKIEKGKIIVIMGRNGSGKTPLALCLNGIIPQLLEGRIQGNVIIAGKDVRKYRTQALASSVGIIFQDPESQIIGLTVEEDTAFGPKNLGFLPEEIKSRVQTELAKVQLAGYESRKTDELSGGEKQRFIIPLFASSIQMAETLSMSIVGRGFGYAETWTPSHQLFFRRQDRIILTIMAGFFILAFYARFVKQWGCL